MTSKNPNYDPFLEQLLQGYSGEEAKEIQEYLNEWDRGTYISVAQSILDHATRKGYNPLKYLRQAHNFTKQGGTRVPKNGYRWDDSAVYRKGNEYLIVRPNNLGIEKIVSYGVNDE